MDNKIIITGVNANNIFDQSIISKLEDIYELTISKPTDKDIKENIEEYEPTAAILCVAEDGDISLQVFNIIKKNSNIPVLIIGTVSACAAAEEAIGKENIIYEIIPPFGVVEIQVALDEYFEQQKLENNEIDDFDFDDCLDEEPKDQVQFSEGYNYYENESESDYGTKAVDNYMHNDNEKKKILIIDDDIKVLRLMNVYLSDKYDVTIMKDGRSARRYLRTNIPHLILLDYVMPLEDGPEVYRKIKLVDRLRKIPIFFLTGVADSKKVKKVLELKPEGYILKPVRRNELLERLDSFFSTYIY